VQVKSSPSLLRMPTSRGSTTESLPLETTKPLVAAAPQQMANATMSVENTNQHPTALELMREDPRMVSTTVGAVAAAAGVAVMAVPPTVVAEEPMAAVTTEAEATRTTTPPATLTAATMPATRMTRSAAPRRPLKSATASPPIPHDFVICTFPRNSNLTDYQV
jgi:hypothetical protein